MITSVGLNQFITSFTVVLHFCFIVTFVLRGMINHIWCFVLIAAFAEM